MVRGYLYGLIGALLAVLGVLLIRHSRMSDQPPPGRCVAGDYWVDCIAGTEVKCPHDTHVYACIDGSWKLVSVSNGSDPEIAIPVPLFPKEK
jgi:hypothetical protein